MASLRSRRASTASISKEDGAQQQFLDSMNETNKERTLALTSITSCYRNAFYATAVDVWSEFSQPSKDSLDTITIILKLLQSLHILGFGIGLYQCTQVYIITIDNKSLSAENLDYICKVMKRVWFLTAVVLTLGSMATSTDIGDYLQDAKWYYIAPLIVFVVSACVSVGIVAWSSKNTLQQKHADDTTHVDKQMETAKQDGLGVLRNMLLCIAALYINALSLFIEDIMDPSASTFEKIYGLMGVAQAVAIAILMTRLRIQVGEFLMAKANISRHDISIENDKNSLNLHKAQHEFYAKISRVFFSAATTKLVSPWLMAMKTSISSNASRDWCNDYPNYEIVQKLAGCGT